MIFFAAVLALVLQTTAAPAIAPETTASQLDARFVTDLHDKKIDDVLTLYAPEAIFVQPDGTQIDSAGLRKLYQQVTTTFDSDLHLARKAFKRNGNTGIEDGAYTETLVHRDTGKVDHLTGTYRFTFHRGSDGAWLFSRMEWR
jgi:ketosteroid isomerase-like protein